MRSDFSLFRDCLRLDYLLDSSWTDPTDPIDLLLTVTEQNGYGTLKVESINARLFSETGGKSYPISPSRELDFFSDQTKSQPE